MLPSLLSMLRHVSCCGNDPGTVLAGSNMAVFSIYQYSVTHDKKNVWRDDAIAFGQDSQGELLQPLPPVLRHAMS